jgi:hypothetical protein
MAGGCFTEVMLHSSKYYHQEHATDPCRLQVTPLWPLWALCLLSFDGVANQWKLQPRVVAATGVYLFMDLWKLALVAPHAAGLTLSLLKARPGPGLLVISRRRQSMNVWQLFCDRFLKRYLLTVSRSFMNVANRVFWRIAIILKVNKVYLFVSSVLFVFWYHSPNFLDTPHYMELLVKPEILTSYIVYMDLRLATQKSVSFNLPHSVSTLQKGYPNYIWDLIRYVKG